MNARIDYLPEANRLQVTFPYNQQAVNGIKEILGRKFIPADKGGPAWSLPATIESARQVRAIFGDRLRLSDEALAWGREQARKERNLMSVSDAEDAELVVLPREFPGIFDLISTRPYQRADVSFMAQTSCINANHPGLGKTIETIGAIVEADLLDGAHLVLAPRTSLHSVWKFHWKQFIGEDQVDIFVAWGPDRDAIVHMALNSPNAFVLIANPDILRLRTGQKDKDGEPVPHPTTEKILSFPDWTTVTVDEYHKSGLPNTKTKFFKSVKRLKAERKFALTGTPIGGKPEKLWSALHFCHPEIFSSKWAWIQRWLETSNNGYGWTIGGIRAGMEDDFYNAHRPYLIRRTKAEAAPDLPPKQYIDLWLPMTPEQQKQYMKFAKDAEIRIDEENLSAVNVLAEYTRLKQFANGKCDLITRKDGSFTLRPTKDSNKFEALLENLVERGFQKDDEDFVDSEPEFAVVGSQFTEVVEAVASYLTENGIDCATLTGKTKQRERDEMVPRFQRGEGPRVMCINTMAGGVSITLDRADTIHVLDETWNPDDQEQLEDRIHRVSLIHQVVVYNYRSEGTIERYISGRTLGKAITNANILDLRRRGEIRAY